MKGSRILARRSRSSADPAIGWRSRCSADRRLHRALRRLDRRAAMPKLSHEALVHLVRSAPELVPELLRDAAGLGLPLPTPSRVTAAEFVDLNFAEHRADAVLLLGEPERPSCCLVVEVQSEVDLRTGPGRSTWRVRGPAIAVSRCSWSSRRRPRWPAGAARRSTSVTDAASSVRSSLAPTRSPSSPTSRRRVGPPSSRCSRSPRTGTIRAPSTSPSRLSRPPATSTATGIFSTLTLSSHSLVRSPARRWST